MQTYCNIEVLSFLISTFNSIINSFGSNKKSIDFYKDQVNNLLSIGQVDKNSVEIVDELINFSYITDDQKWDIELQKVDFFISVIDVVISNAKDTDTAEALLMKLENNGDITKEQKKVINIARKVFRVKKKVPDDIKLTGGSHFGTPDFNGNGRVNIAVIKHILKLAKHGSLVRVQNLDAYCSGDQRWFNYTLNEKLFRSDTALNDIANLVKRGAEVSVVIKHEYGDGCHGSQISYNEDEITTAEFKKFIMDFKPI